MFENLINNVIYTRIFRVKQIFGRKYCFVCKSSMQEYFHCFELHSIIKLLTLHVSQKQIKIFTSNEITFHKHNSECSTNENMIEV